ncbi:MazG-like family protein [Streptomyces sp. NPDC014733]|uniref:MazG-like family protein n=1 Tax=Streptomyces sp. NPDC014733 TaxID=3364885 RepID=UPI0037011533
MREATRTADAPGQGEATGGSPCPAEPSAGFLEATVDRLARRFTAHDTARGLSAVEQWTLQVLKISEETGEAAQAVIGARGTNPRKEPVSWDEVHAEVADVVITALVTLKRMRPDDAEEYLRRQLALKTANFLPDPAAPAGGAPAADHPGTHPS